MGGCTLTGCLACSRIEKINYGITRSTAIAEIAESYDTSLLNNTAGQTGRFLGFENAKRHPEVEP